MEKDILIIDDDTKLNRLLTDYFTRFSFTTKSATTPAEGLRLLEEHMPDIIILDVMLPEMDGFEVCRKIRENYTVPIIMLTARGEVADRVVGLELGADDYLPKPFEPRELVARIQSVLRRDPGKKKRESHVLGALEIDYSSYTVKLNGKRVDLTTMEFEILAMFVKNSGIVLDRDTIFEKIKGLDSDTFDRSIDVMVSRLRQKLEDDPKNPVYLKTIWGKGYKFIGSDSDD